MDGQWGSWSSWSKCSLPTCRSPHLVKRRLCNNPAPRHGGRDCPGAGTRITDTWSVTVKTSSLWIGGAGTDGRVYIQLFGNEGTNGKIELDNPNKDDFERGDEDTYKIEAFIGDRLLKAVISHKRKNNDTWKCQWYRVVNRSKNINKKYKCGWMK